MAKPVLMYHLTTVGEDSGTLRSFFERQAQRVGPEFVPNAGQRNGFFVNSSRTHALKIGLTPIDDDDNEWTARQKGAPMIVTVECDFAEGWDIDYEDSPQVGKMAFFKFSNALEQAAPDSIILSDGTKIQAIRSVEEDTRDGLEFDVLSPYDPELRTLYMPWDDSMDAGRMIALRTMPSEQLKDHVREMNQKPRVSEYALLQSLRDYLVQTQGDAYRKHEEKVIRDAIDKRERISEAQKQKEIHSLGVSLKYSGQQPLKVLKLEVLGPGGRWDVADSPTVPEPA